MRRITAVLIGSLLVPCALHSQETTVEIGTGLGASILTNGGTVTTIGIPGPAIGELGIIGSAPMYISLYFGGGVMVQPEVSFRFLTGEGTDLTTIGLVTNLGYAFSGASRNSPYVAATGAWQFIDADGDSENEFGAGGKVGYRFVVNEGFAVSVEAGYRRWFDSDLNEILFGLRLGGVI
jgi:hypothetical protein